MFFFVVSGYLITAISFAQCKANGFSFSGFYQRRIARIFPVFFVVAFAVLIGAAAVYTSQDLASAGAMASASALSLVNLKLMFQGSYFEISPDSQPFLHFWSLSVEEQFYMFLPVLLVTSRRVRLSTKGLSYTIAGCAAISFALCVLISESRPVWAFYLLPTRAWELLVGALLAVSSKNSDGSSSQCSFDWSIVGLAIVGLSFILVDDTCSFPGAIALLPVIGSVLILAHSSRAFGFGNKLLSHSWCVFVGRISYSLYLWHWPVYCFVDYGLFQSAVVIRVLLKLLLTAVLSIISFTTVEKPARSYLNRPERKWLCFGGFALGVIVLTWSGVATRSHQYVNASIRNVPNGGVCFRGPSESPSIVLMGDSNGSMYGAVMRAIASERGVGLNVISVAAGDPFPNGELYQQSIAFLAEAKPEVTVFAAAWDRCLKDDPEKIDLAIKAVLRHSACIILVTQPPILPETGTRHYLREYGFRAIHEMPDDSERRDEVKKRLLSFRSERVKVVDTDPYFTNDNGEIRFVDAKGRQLFHDRTHLSGYGAEALHESLSEAIFEFLEPRRHKRIRPIAASLRK